MELGLAHLRFSRSVQACPELPAFTFLWLFYYAPPTGRKELAIYLIFCQRLSWRLNTTHVSWYDNINFLYSVFTDKSEQEYRGEGQYLFRQGGESASFIDDEPDPPKGTRARCTGCPK